MSLWLILLLIALVPLAIPLAILLGLRSPNGSLVVTSSATILALAVFWFLLGGVGGLKEGPSSNYPLNFFVLSGALLLIIASWTLGVNAVVQSRRWAWVALLIVTGYLTVFAVIVSIASPDPCLLPPSDPGPFAYCQTSNSFASFLVVAGFFLAPTVALISTHPFFTSRRLAPRRFGPPAGLQVSPLGATSTGDTDPEMQVERL